MKEKIKAPVRAKILKIVYFSSLLGGSAALISSICLFFKLLSSNGLQNFYYYVASSSTIGFGLISLAFSISAFMRKSNETNAYKSNNAKQSLYKYNCISSEDKWIFLICVANEIKTKCLLDFADTHKKTKEEFTIGIIKKIDNELSSQGMDFYKFISPFAKMYYKDIFSSNPKRILLLEISMLLNWAIGQMEPIAYSYVNNEYEEKIFRENIEEDFLLIYSVYLAFCHYGYFERTTNFLDLAFFRIQK